MILHSRKRRKLNSHARPAEDKNGFCETESEQDSSHAPEPGSTINGTPAAHDRATMELRRIMGKGYVAVHSGDAYKTSFTKLQVDEMLADIRLDYAKRKGPVDNALRKLKSIIENIKDQGPLSVSEAIKLMKKSHKIVIPFPDPKPDNDAAYKLLYAQPSDINIVGSYALKTMVKRDHLLAVDMVVTMPVSIFQEKDFLNYRYFYKRAFYLACLAAGLQESAGDEFDFCFSYLGGNSLQPILLVKPVNDQSELSSSKFNIHIIPASVQGVFPQKKLFPEKNAIRSRTEEGVEIEAKPWIPTPFYNATLQTDANFAQYLKLLHQFSKQVEGFTDCCVLGRIWLGQRGLGSTIASGGFGHFEWATLTALLLQGGGPKGQSILSSSYSSYQLFKAMIHYLANNNLVEKPVAFHAPEVSFQCTDSPMFYDGPRGQNILFKMTAWSYAVLYEEAKVSLDMLNDSAFDQFEATFIIRKDNPLQQFDSLLQLSTQLVTNERRNADHTTPCLRLCSKIYAILKEGLADRVKLIQMKVPESIPWPVGSSPSTSYEIFIGVTFVPANIQRVVEYGPAAEDEKAAIKFQKFWGEKAELRRFKDGTIRECCIWANTTDVLIFRDIVTFLINRFFNASIKGHIKFVDERFWPLSRNDTKYFFSLKESFDAFERDIRGLEGLPLQLKQLLATSSQLRYSSAETPSFSSRQSLRDPAEVVIQFESSGRWPDDITAIQRMKIALLLKIGSSMEAAIKGLNARFTLENTERPLHNSAFLDVIYPSGAVFRVRIHNDREQVLLDRLIKDDSVKTLSREEIVTARSLYTRLYVQLPLHSQSIVTNYTRYPLLSPTIRLIKQWFMSHMLSGHVGEELIELIVARTFLQPYPWRAPSSLKAGFLRTLQFISRWDWRITPLIVDFSGTMASKDVATINVRLEAWRKIDPGMNRVAIIAASNHDMAGTAFTGGGPSKVVAARMTALARSALAMAGKQGHSLDPKDLFKSPTTEYDFAIHISTSFTGGQITKESRKIGQYKNLEVQNENVSATGYEPVQRFLDELITLYSPNIVFFYDPFERSVITGLWSPQTVSRVFKTSTPYATKPAGDGNLSGGEARVDIDKCAILSEIARLGGDMIARIDSHQ